MLGIGTAAGSPDIFQCQIVPVTRTCKIMDSFYEKKVCTAHFVICCGSYLDLTIIVKFPLSNAPLAAT